MANSRSPFNPRCAANATAAINAADYIVKGVIEPGSMGAIYGARGAGKTFVALALLQAIAAGTPFAGNRTRNSPVLYLALEGAPKAIERRFKALGQRPELGDVFWQMVTAEQLDDRSYRDQIAAFVKEFGVGIVIFDTLARLVGTRDENTAAGMNYVTAVARQIIGSKAAALFVAHVGKDAERGIRGHSSIEGTLDVMLRIERSGNDRVLTFEKVKDGDDGRTFSFRLEKVSFGFDPDGDEISSMRATGFEPAERAKPQRRLSDQHRLALDALTNAIIEEGEPLPSEVGVSAHGVLCEVWRRSFYSRLGDTEAGAKKKAFQRAIDALQSQGAVVIRGGFAWKG
jgi:KaiC/GvpD/RAD55 family RecA-like ATPase